MARKAAKFGRLLGEGPAAFHQGAGIDLKGMLKGLQFGSADENAGVSRSAALDFQPLLLGCDITAQFGEIRLGSRKIETLYRCSVHADSDFPTKNPAIQNHLSKEICIL